MVHQLLDYYKYFFVIVGIKTTVVVLIVAAVVVVVIWTGEESIACQGTFRGEAPKQCPASTGQLKH